MTVRKSAFLCCLVIGLPLTAADPRIGKWEWVSSHTISDGPVRPLIIESLPGGVKQSSPGPTAGTRIEFSALWDQTDAPVTSSPDVDQVALHRVDVRTLEESFKKAGKTMETLRLTVSGDGKQLVMASTTRPATTNYIRFGAAPDPANPFGGIWTIDEDTVTRPLFICEAQEEDAVHCFRGRSGYTARFDEKDYPSQGTAAETVRLRLIDPMSVEETWKRGGKVIDTTVWTVSPDGRELKSVTDAIMPDGTHVHQEMLNRKQ